MPQCPICKTHLTDHEEGGLHNYTCEICLIHIEQFKDGGLVIYMLVSTSGKEFMNRLKD